MPLLRDRRFRCYRLRRARWTRHAAAIQDTVRYVPPTIYCNNSRPTQILQIIRKQWKTDPTKSVDDSRIEYASPVWSWMCSAADHRRLDSLLRRSKRLGYCSDDLPAVDDLFSSADDELFHHIHVISNSNHVLHPYLPDETNIPFLNDADFIIRQLYKHSYYTLNRKKHTKMFLYTVYKT